MGTPKHTQTSNLPLKLKTTQTTSNNIKRTKILFQNLPPKYLPIFSPDIPPPKPGMRRLRPPRRRIFSGLPGRCLPRRRRRRRQPLGLHFVGATVQQGSRGPCGGMKGCLSWKPQAVLVFANSRVVKVERYSI